MALMMGCEQTGLSRLAREMSDYELMIPTSDHMPSLNVSVATGICLSVVVNQRDKLQK